VYKLEMRKMAFLCCFLQSFLSMSSFCYLTSGTSSRRNEYILFHAEVNQPHDWHLVCEPCAFVLVLTSLSFIPRLYFVQVPLIMTGVFVRKSVCCSSSDIGMISAYKSIFFQRCRRWTDTIVRWASPDGCGSVKHLKSLF
jgi:hypothetical protein